MDLGDIIVPKAVHQLQCHESPSSFQTVDEIPLWNGKNQRPKVHILYNSQFANIVFESQGF